MIADLKGKAGHIRTVPVPQWVKAAVDVWSIAAGITEGTVFRSINKSGSVWGDGMTPGARHRNGRSVSLVRLLPILSICIYL